MESWGISVREDGTIERLPVARVEPSPHHFLDGVASKDVRVFLHHPPPAAAAGEQGLWARIFLPLPHPSLSLDHLLSNPPSSPQLPVILYFHGGGFVLRSVAGPIFHPFLHRLAKSAQAIVVAVEYRLAPEHRLPAAFDDCLASVSWLQSQASPHDADTTDPWLGRFADFSRCYLMGDSAGGNIVYNLSLKLANMKTDPLHIRGHVLIHPFFGGVASTETEEILVNDGVVPLSGAYWCWEQALPKGADRDHPSSKPMSIPSSVYANAHLPKTLVAIAHGDPMKDRQMQYFTTLKEAGVDVHVQLEDAGKHAFYLHGTEKAITCFLKDIVTFLHDC